MKLNSSRLHTWIQLHSERFEWQVWTKETPVWINYKTEWMGLSQSFSLSPNYLVRLGERKWRMEKWEYCSLVEDYNKKWYTGKNLGQIKDTRFLWLKRQSLEHRYCMNNFYPVPWRSWGQVIFIFYFHTTTLGSRIVWETDTSLHSWIRVLTWVSPVLAYGGMWSNPFPPNLLLISQTTLFGGFL